MNKTMKLTMIFILTIMFSTFTIAQIDNVGTSAANFLKIGLGARAQSMGGAYIAQADEVSALYWNPAGILKVNGQQVQFSQIDWITDVNLSFLGGVVSIDESNSLGIGITYLSMGTMKVTDWTNPEGTGETFDANDMAIGVTYARKISEKFDIGVQVKYIQETISQSSASAFAVDIGAQYNTGFNGLKLGMVLTNFGSEMQMSGRDLDLRTDPYDVVGSNPEDVHANLETVSWPLPIAIRLGASWDAINSESIRITANADFNDPRDVDQNWSSGVEVALLNEQFFLRGGANNYFEDEIRPSFGAGLKYNFDSTYGIVIDYAYSDLGRLENANRFTLSLKF